MPERRKLLDGFERFKARYYGPGTSVMPHLVRQGAEPEFFIINCIDPRNGADVVFDAPPGQQFVNSQMAAIVPPFDPRMQREIKASLRFAIDVKHVKHLIIMGHSHCSGCEALVAQTEDEHIGPWVAMAHNALERAQALIGTDDPKELLRETERQVIVLSLRNILTYPTVRRAFTEGRLTVNGWFFDMEAGRLSGYDPGRDSFLELISASAAPQTSLRRVSGQ